MASAAVGPQSPLHAQRRRRSTSRSRSRSPSASLFTVTDHGDSSPKEEKLGADDCEAPSSPSESTRPSTPFLHGGNSDISPVCSTHPSLVSRPPVGSPLSSCLEGKDEKGESEEAAAAAVLVVSPGLAECNIDVNVRSGDVVRWIQGAYAQGNSGGGKEEHVGATVDGGGRAESVSGGRDQDDVGGSGNGGGGNGKREPMTIIIVSDVLDAPMTRQIPSDGSCAELIFNQPGNYTYHVCSGPITKGRVIVKQAPATATMTDGSSAASPNGPLPVGDEEEGDIAEPASAGATVDSDMTAAPSSLSRVRVDARVNAAEDVVPTRDVGERDAKVCGTMVKFQETLLHPDNSEAVDATTRMKGLSSANKGAGGQSSGVGSCASLVAPPGEIDKVAGESASPPPVVLLTRAMGSSNCSPGRDTRDGQGTGESDETVAHLSKQSNDGGGLSCDIFVLASSDSERQLSQQGDCGHDVTEEELRPVTVACLASDVVEEECARGDAPTRKICPENDDATADPDNEDGRPNGTISLEICHDSSSLRNDVVEATKTENAEQTVQDVVPQPTQAKGAALCCDDGGRGEEEHARAQGESKAPQIVSESMAGVLDGPLKDSTSSAVEEAENIVLAQGPSLDQVDEGMESPPAGANVGGDPVLQQAPEHERTEAAGGKDVEQSLVPFTPPFSLTPALRPDHLDTSLGRDGSGGNSAFVDGDQPSSFDSDDVPSGSWLGAVGKSTPASGGAAMASPKGALKQRPPSPMNPRAPSSSSVPLTLAIIGVVAGGEKSSSSSGLSENCFSPLPTTSAAAQPWISSSRVGPRKQRVEVLQRDESGQEWQEFSPLTSPATGRSAAGDVMAFSCAKDNNRDPLPAVPMTMAGDGGAGKEEQVVTAEGVAGTGMDVVVSERRHMGGAEVEVNSSSAEAVKEGDSTGLLGGESGGSEVGETSDCRIGGTNVSSAKLSLSSCRSRAADAAAMAAGVAAAAGAAEFTHASSVLARHEASVESGGTAPASPAEENPRCLMWSADGDAYVSSEGTCDSSTRDASVVCSSVAVEDTSPRSLTPPCSEGIARRCQPNVNACSDAVVDAAGYGVHVVMIMEDDQAGRALFEPGTLTAPIGTWVRWERRGGGIDSSNAPTRLETFKGRVFVGNDDNGEQDANEWKVAFSFVLSAARPSFVHTFSREGRYEISSDGEGMECGGTPGPLRQCEIVIERVAGVSESDSFASGGEDGGSSSSFEPDTDEGHDDEQGTDSESFASPSPQPNPPPSSVTTSKRDSIAGRSIPEDIGADNRRKRLENKDSLITSTAALVSRAAEYTRGVAVYSSSGVSTQDSVVSAPTAPPSVAVLTTAGAGSSMSCVGVNPVPAALRRPRSLPSISALLGSREAGGEGDRGEGGTESYGHSGWSLQTDRLKVLGSRRPTAESCSTATATTELSSVPLDDATIPRGRISPARSYSDVEILSGLTDGQQQESPRAYSVDGDDDAVDGDDDTDSSDTLVDASYLDNHISRRTVNARTQSCQSTLDATVTAAVSSTVNPHVGSCLEDKDGGSDDGSLLRMKIATVPSSFTVTEEMTPGSGGGGSGGGGVCGEEGAGGTAAAESSLSPGGGSEDGKGLELVGSEKAAGRKKKKKKAKKKSKAGRVRERGGNGGGGRGDGGAFDVGRQVWGDQPALLQEEGIYLEKMQSVEHGVGRGGREGRVVEDGQGLAKVVKTIISCEQGFKPTKPVTVQVEAIVSIRKTTVSSMRCTYRPRRITLAGPVENNRAKSSRFLEGSNKTEDMPRASTTLDTWFSGKDLEAVFRTPGEYYLVDHWANKRLKITATPPEASPPPTASATSRTRSGEDGEASSLTGREDDVLDAKSPAQRTGSMLARAEPSTSSSSFSSSFSRSKKKKGKGKVVGRTSKIGAGPGTVPALVEEAPDASPAVPCVLPTAETSGDDLVNDGDENVDHQICGGGDNEHATAVTDAQAACRTEDSERQESPGRLLLPATAPAPAPAPSPSPTPTVASREGPDLSAGEREEFEHAGAVGRVTVSHKRGFEPTALEIGFASGRGALVICELDHQERVTREVVCRRTTVPLPVEGGIQSAAETDCGTPDPLRKLATVGGGKDASTFISARLGPGPLSVCCFLLGHVGEYRVAYREDAERGFTVVVKQSANALAGCEPTSASTAVLTSRADGEAAAGDWLRPMIQNDKKQGSLAAETINSSGDAQTQGCSEDSSTQRSDETSREEGGGGSDGGDGGRRDDVTSSSGESGPTTSSPAGANAVVASVSQPPQDHASRDSRSRGNAWCEDVAVGEPGDLHGGGSFVRQRSRGKKSKRWQKTNAKKKSAAKVERIETQAAAAAAAAAELEAVEAAAAIEAVRAHIAEQEQAADTLATKQLLANEVPKAMEATTDGSTPTAVREEEWTPLAISLALPGVAAPETEEAKAPANTEVIDEASLAQTSSTGNRTTNTVNVTPAASAPIVHEQSNTVIASPKLAPAPVNNRPLDGESPALAVEPTATNQRNDPKASKSNCHGSRPSSTSAPSVAQGAPSITRRRVGNSGKREFHQHQKPATTAAAITSPTVPSAAAAPSVVAKPSGRRASAVGASWTDTRSTAAATRARGSGKARGSSGAAPHPRSYLSPKGAPVPPASAEWGTRPATVVSRQPRASPLALTPLSKDLQAPVGCGGSAGATAVAAGDSHPASSSRSVTESGCEEAPEEGGLTAVESAGACSVDDVSPGAEADGLPRPHSQNPARARRTATSTQAKVSSSSSSLQATSENNLKGNEKNAAEVSGVPPPPPPPSRMNADDEKLEDQDVLVTEPTPACSRSDEAEPLNLSFGDFAPPVVDVVTGNPGGRSKQQQEEKPSAYDRSSDNGSARSSPVSETLKTSLCNTSTISPQANPATEEDGCCHIGVEGGVPPAIVAGNDRSDVSAEIRATELGTQPSGGERSGQSCDGPEWSYSSEGLHASASDEVEGGSTNCSSCTTSPRRGSSGDRGDSAVFSPSPPLSSSCADDNDNENHNENYPVVQSTTSTTPVVTATPLRWGNFSTKISYEERLRRSQELGDTIRRHPYQSSSKSGRRGGHYNSRGGGIGRPKPAAFPESSRLPTGGYAAPEAEDGCLPPASEYEKLESARMMKLYYDMINRLQKGGVDRELPNGHVPVIYDLTERNDE